jgi:methylphosphotriester-DNA--protein-cysteine methyltransferase
MERCPLCRAALNGARTCRRCKAELGSARDAEAESRALAGAAMYRLASGAAADGIRLLRLAMDRHATPEVRALWRLATSPPPDAAVTGLEPPSPYEA